MFWAPTDDCIKFQGGLGGPIEKIRENLELNNCFFAGRRGPPGKKDKIVQHFFVLNFNIILSISIIKQKRPLYFSHFILQKTSCDLSTTQNLHRWNLCS